MPATPTNFEALAGDRHIILRFTPPGGAVQYRVVRNGVELGAFDFQLVDGKLVATDYDVTNGASYTYTVTAQAEDDSVSYPTSPITVTAGAGTADAVVPLVQLSRLKDRLGITDSASDAKLDQIIQSASDAIRGVTHQDFRQATRTEVFNGTDSFRRTYITVQHRPIASITSIGMACAGSDDFHDVPCLDRYKPNNDRGTICGYFPSGYQNVQIVYVGGYTVVPESVQQAAIDIALLLYGNDGKNAALKSEKIGDYSWARADGGSVLVPETAMVRLAPYMDDPIL